MNQSTNPFRDIERQIAGGNLEKALNSLTEFSEKLVAEPRMVASVFGSRRLDAFCQAIGAEALQKVDPNFSEPLERGSRILILVTEVYRSGGHTAVVKDLIDAYRVKGLECLVIVADTFQTANYLEITSTLSGTQVMFAPKQLGAFERVMWLQRQILAEKPNRIFLFGHMHDAVIIAAIQPELSVTASFFHHSDHRFSLGIFLPHLQHIDFRESGLENCRLNLDVENNWLLPLTNPDVSAGVTRDKFYSSGALRTCTTGSYKFDAPYAFSLSEDVIPDIIAATGGSHIHIGPLSQKNVSVIRETLSKRKIPQERFVVIELVNSLWSALIEFEVDVYIDSFPICGCRSVVEVMGAGVPLVVHENYKSRLLSNKDLAYKEAFSWREPAELYRYLLKLDVSQLKQQSRLAREHFERKHHTSLFAEALERLDQFGTAPAVPKLLTKFYKDECFEIFEYERNEVAIPEPENRSNDEVRADQLVWVLRAIFASEAKVRFDKAQLSKMLFAAAMSNNAIRRSKLSETLLHAADTVYPEGDNAIIDKERISEFLFRFSVSTSENDIDIAALHTLPTELALVLGVKANRE